MSERKKIAAAVSTFYPASRADVIVTKFVKGFPTDEGLREPAVDIVSMYMDQVSEKDIGLELAKAGVERVDRQEGADGSLEELIDEPALFLLEYRDGLRAALLQPNSYGGKIRGWSYAARTGGKVKATRFNSHGNPYPHFSYLSLNAQEMFLTGKPQYPVERTLLVSGALDALMESRFRDNARLETPHLDVAYRPAEKPPIRPAGPEPVGASTEPMH